MGQCCLTVPESGTEEVFQSKEEEIIQSIEKQAPFYSVKLKDLEKCLETQQYEHKLNKGDIRKVLSSLGLHLEMLTDPDCPQFKYFEGVVDKDKLYTQRKLILSTVLVSHESIETKIGMIEKYYDFSGDKIFQLGEIEKLIDEIVESAAKTIPLMAVGEENETQKKFLTEDEYLKYSGFLLSAKKPFIEKYSTSLLGNFRELPFQDLAERLKINTHSVLLSSRMVRTMLYSLTKVTASK